MIDLEMEDRYMRFFCAISWLAVFVAWYSYGADLSDRDFFSNNRADFNCYSYAIGDRCHGNSDAHLYPGQMGGAKMAKITPFELNKAMLADGATLASESFEVPPPKPGYRLIAAVISPVDEKSMSSFAQPDFHFYRQEPNGKWTHKPGKSTVLDLDADGNPISNPAYASRDYRNVFVNGLKWPYNYKYFVGFYYVKIKPVGRCP